MKIFSALSLRFLIKQRIESEKYVKQQKIFNVNKTTQKTKKILTVKHNNIGERKLN